MLARWTLGDDRLAHVVRKGLSGVVAFIQVHLQSIQGALREHSGNVEGNMAGNIQGIFREHERKIEGTLREH
jgi:hypothetical protein